jgi:hypothetical protein
MLEIRMCKVFLALQEITTSLCEYYTLTSLELRTLLRKYYTLPIGSTLPSLCEYYTLASQEINTFTNIYIL